VGVIVLNVTFNNISAISWGSVLLGEIHRPAASHCQTLSHTVAMNAVRTHNVSGDRH
jgi:hypothetical protein